MMNKNENHYASYLLRIWRVKTGEEMQWRITLEDTLNSKLQSFPNLEALCEYLQNLGDAKFGEDT